MDNHVGSETREKGFSSKSIFQKGFWRGTGNARNPNGEALLRGIGWAAASFILGICRLPFSVYPLGMAILCASDTYIGFSVAGLVVASFFLPIPWWIYLGAVALTLLGRILTRLLVDIPVRTHEVTGFRGMLEHIHGRLFCESLYLRMSSSCVATFLLSLYALFVGGFRYYDVFGAFFSIFSASVATFFLCSFSGDMPFGQRFVFWIRRIAECLLAFSICLSFSEMRLQGISLGVATAFVATLILCRKEGLFIGLLTSLLCGFSCGGSYFAIFPVVAITAFCLFEFSPYLSAFVSCVIGSVTGVLLVGKDNLLVIFLPLIFGAASYCTYEKLLAKGGFHTLFWPSKQRVSCEHLRLERQYAETCEEVGAFCHSLKTLSESFSHMNENMRKPVDRELKEICDVCLGDVCAVCDNRSGCLETRYTLMEEATERMMLRLKKDGIVAMENLPK